MKDAATDRRTWVLIVMCAGMFLVLLDATVINVALPAGPVLAVRRPPRCGSV